VVEVAEQDKPPLLGDRLPLGAKGLFQVLAYHSDQEVKSAVLAQLQAHHDADEIIKGVYWQRGKGCAVGCTIHSGNHVEYEPRFGIPQALARIEDRVFEGLPNDRAKLWPLQFMDAIRPGADLSRIWPQFAVWLLTDKSHGVIRHARTDALRAITAEISYLYARGETDRAVWYEVWTRARAIRAAAATAYAAATAAAADSAAEAARAAEDTAAAAAYATAAYATDADDEAARQEHFAAQADKLIELLRAA
jgi:hypothetical protein